MKRFAGRNKIQFEMLPAMSNSQLRCWKTLKKKNIQISFCLTWTYRNKPKPIYRFPKGLHMELFHTAVIGLVSSSFALRIVMVNTHLRFPWLKGYSIHVGMKDRCWILILKYTSTTLNDIILLSYLLATCLHLASFNPSFFNTSQRVSGLFF